MAIFLGMLLIFWAVALVAYFVFARWFRSSDVDKIKSRLTGNAKKIAEKSVASKVALFDLEDKPVGKIIPQLMKKFNLNEKLQELLEQAGLKWKPVKLAHFCLAGFLVGYGVSYLFLPSSMRTACLIVGRRRGRRSVVVRDTSARHASEGVRGSVSGNFGVHFAVDARRPCVLGIARNDSSRVSGAVVGRVPPHL